MYYRTTVLYKGEGKPYHNTYGGTIIVNAETKELAMTKSHATFKGILDSQGFGKVDFVIEAIAVSDDEVRYLLENKSKGMIQ